MKSRLPRALQRGGVAAQTQSDLWGVWRGKDRRGRKIRAVNGCDVEILRVLGQLKALGDHDPPLLVWCGTVPAQGKASAARLSRADAYLDAPLIERVIANCTSEHLRTRFRDIALTYRRDVEASQQSGIAAGMNWTGLALGGRVQGGRGPERDHVREHISQARHRLESVKESVSADELGFLDRLIVAEQTRQHLAKHYAVRPSLVEQRASTALRSLIECNDRNVKVRE